MNRRLTAGTLAAFFLWIVPALLQASPPGDSSVPAKPWKVVTHHSIKLGDKVISYVATAGTLILTNAKEEPVASFGYTAYTLEPEKGKSENKERPVIFSYNGGPGSSSMWLHMGVMGPRRVVVSDPDYNGPPPYKVEDNPNCLLDVADIVMMDPVGTGLSRAIGKGKSDDFWSVDGDIQSVSEFIKNYVTENGRWNAPKYLLGESYGTFRSAGVADYLQQRMGIALNGVVLVSSVLDIRTLAFLPGDDISYIVNLPSYAATAWYHHKLTNKPANLPSFLEEVRSFATGPYAAALMKGDRLGNQEKEEVLAKLVAYTGLSKDYWQKANLRVNEPQFTQELRRNENVVVGRLDSRYKGISGDALSEYSYTDPQSDAISPAYIAAFMNYYTTELNVDKGLSYNTSAYALPGFNWNWSHSMSNGLFGDASTPNTAPDLVDAMSKNPKLKVMVLNGYYDLATPFFGTEFTFDHLGIDPSIRKNISMKYYEAGHMMYIHGPSAEAFHKDVADFIKSTQ